jgi:hypothetical protein
MWWPLIVAIAVFQAFVVFDGWLKDRDSDRENMKSVKDFEARKRPQGRPTAPVAKSKAS